MVVGTGFILDLGILVSSALLLSLLFARLRLPVVPAQILAGMLVGPYVLDWVSDTTTINDIASIGIVLLLFVIGLELDPIELRKVASKVTVITTIEILLSFTAGYGASLLLGLGMLQSLVFATAVSITSTAIVGKVFLAKRALGQPEAGALIGIMILEDIFAVVALVAISSAASTGTSFGQGYLDPVVVTLLGGGILIGSGYLVATYLAPRAIDYLSAYELEYEEIPFLFALGLGFFFAVLAAVFGYSPGMGAFIIGLSIRGKRSKFLERRISTIKDLFVLIFFISMGGLINPWPSIGIGLPLLSVLALAVGGKFAGGFAASKMILRTGMDQSVQFGTWLIPRGEFSLVIGQLALTLGIIDEASFSLIGLVVLVSAVVGPVAQRMMEPKMAPAEFPSKSLADAF